MDGQTNRRVGRQTQCLYEDHSKLDLKRINVSFLCNKSYGTERMLKRRPHRTQTLMAIPSSTVTFFSGIFLRIYPRNTSTCTNPFKTTIEKHANLSIKQKDFRLSFEATISLSVHKNIDNRISYYKKHITSVLTKS